MKLQILPHYTGDQTLEEALKNPKGLSLLWLEILFNGEIPWKDLDIPEVKTAYEKACAWHGHFKTMIEGHVGPRSLKGKGGELEDRGGEIDMREHRKFLEALYFAAGRV